jgi:hypothetical protein
MNTSRKTRFSMVVALSLALAVGAVSAQDTPPTDAHNPGTMGSMHPGQGNMGGMKGMHGNMMGMHAMPATVSAVDAKTGVVDVMTEGMALKVHFPPPAVSKLKAGEKITLHMGFSKP